MPSHLSPVYLVQADEKPLNLSHIIGSKFRTPIPTLTPDIFFSKQHHVITVLEGSPPPKVKLIVKHEQEHPKKTHKS